MMGTTYQALKDYAENLRTIQFVARAWAAGPGVYADLKPALDRAVSDCQGQMLLIRTAIQESPVEDGWKTAVDADIVGAFDETAMIVADPTRTDTMGKLGQVPPGAWEPVIAEAQKASKTLVRLFKWIIGISAAAGTFVVLGPLMWQRINDPYGFKASQDIWVAQQVACTNAMTAAGTDPEKLESAKAFCSRMKQQADEELGAGGCGLLETPYGTIIGLLLGAGFGWAGLRKIMAL